MDVQARDHLVQFADSIGAGPGHLSEAEDVDVEQILLRHG